ELVSKRYDAALWSLAGNDFKKLEQVVRANLEFLRCERRSVEMSFGQAKRVSKTDIDVFVLDEDAQALGISTRSVALLDAVVAALKKDAKDQRVRRLLARYLPEQEDASPERLGSWLAEHRGQLFFSDVGGFRWFVAGPEDQRRR